VADINTSIVLGVSKGYHVVVTANIHLKRWLWSQYNAISIVTRLQNGIQYLEFQSRQGKEFSHLQTVHTGFGAHPASWSIGTGALSPRIKRPG
jgi:hypothetical protein